MSATPCLRRTRRTARGFTLIEILVSVTLLSMIMLAMNAALRTIAQTESRVDQRIARTDDMRWTVQLLQQVLGRVSGRKVPAPAGNTGQQVLFHAAADRLEWVGIMPARPGAGGRHFFRLQMEPGPQGQSPQLVLRLQPWSVNAPQPDWGSAQARLLGGRITQFAVQAQGDAPGTGAPPAGWPQGWVDGWPVADALPSRVRLLLADEQGAWPDIIIPLDIAQQGKGSGGGFSIGGAAR